MKSINVKGFLIRYVITVGLAVFAPFFLCAQEYEGEEYGGEDYNAYDYGYEEGMKSMVDRLPLYEGIDINSPVIMYIPYSKEFMFQPVYGDKAWISAYYEGKWGFTLSAGCSYNGVDSEKGKAWFEENLKSAIKALGADPATYKEAVYHDDEAATSFSFSPLYITLCIAGICLVVLLIISSRLELKRRYTVTTFGCGACIVVLIITLGKIIAYNDDSLLKIYFALTTIAWLVLGRVYFWRMARYEIISNEFIKVCWFATFIGITICFANLFPTALYQLIAIIAIFPVWFIQSPTRHRCPKCHRMAAFYWNRKEKAGTQTEVKRDTSSSKETLNQQHGVRVIDETVRTTTTNVYQMWRHYKKCLYCGYEESERKKGNLISSKRHIKTETETRDYPF